MHGLVAPSGAQVAHFCVLSVPLLLRVLSATKVNPTAPAIFETKSSTNNDIVFLTKTILNSGWAGVRQ